jgi:DNA-binding MarR family transcriptional regulator
MVNLIKNKALGRGTAVTKRPAGRRLGANARHVTKISLQSTLPPTISMPELLDEDGVSDRRFRQLLYDFSALGAYLECAREYFASEVGLSAPEYNCAMIIAQYQGSTGVSVSEVAKHLHVSTAFVTSVTGKLEQAGLIRKHRNPNDGRGILLLLTKLGKARLREIEPQRLLINNSLFRSITTEDFRSLARIATLLIDDFATTVNMIKVMKVEGTRRP